jgi:hypothetical protein
MQGPDESVAKLFLVESEGEGSHEGIKYKTCPVFRSH